MFEQLFGQFLVETKRLTESQMKEILKKQNQVRVKLGLIAVSENLMTSKQADEINLLQAIMDKRFGDIAVEKGYLLPEQVDKLLSLQGNAYLAFVQNLMDSKNMTMSEIEDSLSAFQTLNNYSDEELNALKSDDLDRILPLLTKKVEEPYLVEIIGIFVRTFMRLIDSNAYVGEVCKKDVVTVNCYAEQKLEGKYNITLAFADRKKDGFVYVANQFAKENFTEVDEDVLDACCEFLNCINGMFATALSEREIEVDMLPPQYGIEEKKYQGNHIYEIPVHLIGMTINAVIVV